MKVQMTIRKDGKVITEVLDRQEHACSKVYSVTNALGKQLSDEETGPECDTANEISTES